MADDKRYRLDALDFLLRANKLTLEVSLFVLDIAFLDVEKFEVTRKLLVLGIEVLFLELFVKGRLFGQDGLESRFLDKVCTLWGREGR